MRLGIDFDNTIVCYDSLFYRLACEQALIPPDLPATKQQVRDYLRACGAEDRWTEMQGHVYGSRMAEAEAFPGVLDCFAWLQAKEIPYFIISHKTRYPFAGPQYDLHAAARDWLERQGLYRPGQVFFELTKAEKLARIAAQQCTHFIDDLPEFLLESDFPPGVARILFDPGQAHPSSPHYQPAASWAAIQQMLLV